MSNKILAHSMQEDIKSSSQHYEHGKQLSSHCLNRGKSELRKNINFSAGQFSPTPYCETLYKLGNAPDNLASKSSTIISKNKNIVRFFKLGGKKSEKSIPKKQISGLLTPLKSQAKSSLKAQCYDEIEKFLQKTEPSQPDMPKLDLCKQALSQIIKKEKSFGNLLKIIKSEYENHIDSLIQMLDKTTNMLKSIDVLSKNLETEITDLKVQNANLNAQMKQMYNKYTSLEVKFKEITDIDIDNVEKSDENWKKLIMENKIYQQIVEVIKKDCFYYKEKAIKMMRLISYLDKKGYPIDSIYKSEIRQSSEHKNEKDKIIEDISFEVGSKCTFVSLESFPTFDTPILSKKSSGIISNDHI